MREPTKTWLKAAGVRAVKTFAQATIAAIGTTAVLGGVDWLTVLSIAGLSALLSILTSLAGLPEVTPSTIAKEGDTPNG